MFLLSVCLAFVAFCSIYSSHLVVGALGLTLFSSILVSTWVGVPFACSVFIALLAWCCQLNYSSLAVLGISSPHFFFFFRFLA